MHDNARMSQDVSAWWAPTDPTGPRRGPVRVLGSGPGWDAGLAAADAAIDSGVAVLIIIDDTAPSPTARAVGALLTGLDASRAIPAEMPPLAWMQECAIVRDHIPGLRAIADDPIRLAQTDPVLAYATAALITSLHRRIPVIVSGVVPHIAALCAQRTTRQASEWVRSGFDDDDPVAVAARQRLDLRPWIAATVPLSDAQRTTMLRTILEGGAN